MSIVRRSAKEIRKRGGGRVDWKRVRATTHREIAAQIVSDAATAPDMSRVRDMCRVPNPPLPDVKAIRAKLRLSQAAFARRFDFSVRTVQQWEQGRACRMHRRDIVARNRDGAKSSRVGSRI